MVVASCAHRTTQPSLDTDQTIKQAVEDALMIDPRVTPLAPKVGVKKGIVVLSGSLADSRAREAAEEDALNTNNVRAVVNLMKVGERTKRPWAPGGMEDEENEKKLRAEMALEQGLTTEQRKNIEVEVEGDVVVLKGQVRNNFIREKAWFADANVEGVDEVRNELRIVRDATSGRDKILEDEINYGLMWNPKLEWLDDKIDIRVENKIALITGEVDSKEEKQAVLLQVREAGIRKVIDRLKVI